MLQTLLEPLGTRSRRQTRCGWLGRAPSSTAGQGRAGRQPEARLGSACPALRSRPHRGSPRLAAGRTPARGLSQSEAAKAISEALIGCPPRGPGGGGRGERRAAAAGGSASPCRPWQPGRGCGMLGSARACCQLSGERLGPRVPFAENRCLPVVFPSLRDACVRRSVRVCMCVMGEGGWLSPGLLAVRSRVNQNQTRYFRQTSLTRCPSAQRSRGGPAGRSRVRKLPDPRRGCWVREPRGSVPDGR